MGWARWTWLFRGVAEGAWGLSDDTFLSWPADSTFQSMTLGGGGAVTHSLLG